MNESCPQNKTNMLMYSLAPQQIFAELCLQVNLSEFYVACHPRVYVNFVSRASEKSHACYEPKKRQRLLSITQLINSHEFPVLGWSSFLISFYR